MTSDDEQDPGAGAPGSLPVAGTVIAVGVVVIALLVAALVTLVALVAATDSAPAERTVTTAADDVTTTTSVRLVPPSTRNIRITDEPIVIDAEGNVLMPEPATTGSAPPTVTTQVPSTEGSDDGLNLLGGDDPEDRRMPDVVCMGLQAAQDEIQDHGVFFSKSVDATGKGRRQLWDRNWIVVAQEPAAGEKIGEFEAVLSVVKTNEDNPC